MFYLYKFSISSKLKPLVSGMKKNEMTATKIVMQQYIKNVPWIPSNEFHVGTVLVLTNKLRLSKMPRSELPKDLACAGSISPWTKNEYILKYS